MNWSKALDTSKRLESDAKSESPTTYPSFAPVLSEVFEQLKDLPEKYEVPAGTVLLEQGTIPGQVLLLRRGLVKLGYVSADGNESTLGLRSGGWYAGAISVLMNVPSVYSVTTVSPCTISGIPAHEFPLKLMQSAKMMRHFLATLCTELTTQAGTQAQIMSSSAEDRLACFMRERNNEYAHWKTLDPLPMLKQMELAQLLSIKPETLSRLMHRREQGGARKSATRTGTD